MRTCWLDTPDWLSGVVPGHFLLDGNLLPFEVEAPVKSWRERRRNELSAQKIKRSQLMTCWIWLNIIFVNFTPTFVLTKWWVKSIRDLWEICQCVAQREAFVWHKCSSWPLVSRVCARVVICVRWPPLRSADAAKYAKLSRLMTSMMGLTTRVWSCTGRERERRDRRYRGDGAALQRNDLSPITQDGSETVIIHQGRLYGIFNGDKTRQRPY